MQPRSSILKQSVEEQRRSEEAELTRRLASDGWSSDKYCYVRQLLAAHRRPSRQWAVGSSRFANNTDSDSDNDSDTSSDASNDHGCPVMSLLASSNADEATLSKKQRQQLLQLDMNNSGGQASIDMLNLPSTAETLARHKSWIVVYFRYRVKWCEAKPHLEKLSKEEAYQPQNLPLWTRYVKISQHRKVPFLHSVRAFRNRVQVPGTLVRYTLNAFYHKGADKEKARNAGPLHPMALPMFRCPDDLPEFRKMAVAVTNVFVTTDDTYFDEFWKECGNL